MSFAVHTFEINPQGGKTHGFAFHESLSEGQDVYFLSQFGDNNENAKLQAETIFSAIVTVLESGEISDSYDRFEEALKQANLAATKYRWDTIPEIVVAFFDFHNVYLSQSGESEAYLVREGAVSQISESQGAGNDLFVNILNGQVSVGDTILLSSTRLLRFLTASQMGDIFSRADFDDAAGIFRHELSTASDQDLLVTVIGIGQQSGAPAAGFLNKVLSKANPLKNKPAHEVTPSATETTLDGEDFEEVIEEEYTMTEEIISEAPEKGTPVWAEALKRIQSLFSNSNMKAKKPVIVIAGAILGVLVLLIAVKSILNFESAETAELRQELMTAKEAFSEADSLLLQGENTEAKTYLEKAQASVQLILNSETGSFRSDAQVLQNDIEEKMLQVENARKVQPQLLADLGLKEDNLEALGLVGLRGNLFAYDTKSVYKTVRNIVEKGQALSEKETVVAAAAREDQNTLLFVTDTPRIIEYREGVISPMSTDDETWRRGIDIKTYGRYAYLLDPVENQIWKYQRRQSSYSEATPYSQGADLSRAVSMAIDGAIFLLSDDGTIQKIFKGEAQTFEFKESPSVPFSGTNLRIYTTAELDYLYVLDPDNQRLMVFNKGERFATYSKQFLYGIPEVVDFVIDESGLKANLLTKDKIYEFSL